MYNYVFPDTMEARYLYNYAQSLELLDDDPLNNPEISMGGVNCQCHICHYSTMNEIISFIITYNTGPQHGGHAYVIIDNQGL